MRFLILTGFLLWHIAMSHAAELPDIKSVPPDLHTPPMVAGEPAAGRRVRQTTPGWENTAVHHTLYLPDNWRADGKFPVIFEYAGNGNYSNKFGDVSAGTVEGSNLGYGISGGSNFIWVCQPFVAVTNGTKTNAITWWGDVEETVRYCKATVHFVCERFGGDTNRVVLAGFSRGAIACNFIGLHDDEIARLWRGFICHSHYDGVRTSWPYADADRASALERLKRLNGRRQFISHEGSVADTQRYLEQSDVRGRFTLVPLPFRNHTDAWVLRSIPERTQLRAWLDAVTRE